MLNNELIKQIEDFVCSKPRSIHEIAQLIGKSWRTADRYIQEIQENFGTILVRTFRPGTRGALKIVYWASIEKISNSAFQKQLEQQILLGKTKENFSAFDIFQYIPDKNKKATIEKTEQENLTNLKEFDNLIKNTKKQLLIFSGNLSLINMKNKETDIFKSIEELVKRDIKIKIICRVDLVGKENIEKILSLNFKHGKESIEIRHGEHPLRAIVFDNNLFRIKEIKKPTGRTGELNQKVFIFYTIKDKEWTEWISKIFWKIFNSSISAEKRIQEIKKLI